jgi:hypothetical protein
MSSIEALTARLDRVERDARRWRAVAVAAVLAWVGLFAAGAGREEPPQEIKARRFVLQDERGRTRANLGMSPEGEPVLLFVGEGGMVTYATPWNHWDQRKHPFLPLEHR